MDEALLDTDILSEVLKAKNPRVLSRASDYLARHGRLCFSAMTFYEMIRGIRATKAIRQLHNFTTLAATSDMLPVSLATLDRAASLWAEAHMAGHPRNDADLIIAATALETNRVLVTGDTGHFDWISQLRIEDWR
jgi:predicted nucleic acid-binding protein